MGKQKIVYSVHGYGRGHAARAQAILPELTRRYDVLVLAGDDAWDQLHEDFPVVRIPVLRYYQRAGGCRSTSLTLRRNVPLLHDMLLGGPIRRMVSKEIQRFGADVVISDSEGWTHHAARRLGVGRISFDHYGIMAFCRPPMSRGDRLVCWAESLVYRALVCNPDRVIAVAFFDAEPSRSGVSVVGPILREAVRKTPSVEGDYLLAYFSNAEANFTPRIEQALRALDMPVVVYGPKRRGVDGRLDFRPAANEPFVRDLAGCRAVFSTAGNQLISEALHFGKPLMLMPEDSLEQRLNARIVRDWGIGTETRRGAVSVAALRTFMARRDEFASRVRLRRRDGLAEALAEIDGAIEDLVAQRSGGDT